MFSYIHQVRWSYLPWQCLNVLGLAIVVIFGSSLDIAAIQAELDYKLDANNEMMTVGISNILNFAGGCPGSYIFSQTIFSLKMGVTSLTMGMTIIVLEFLFWLFPFDIL